MSQDQSNSPAAQSESPLVHSFTRLHSLRSLRDAIMKSALDIAQDPDKEAVILLLEPDITSERLQQERSSISAILKPHVAKRLYIVEVRDCKSSPALPEHIKQAISPHIQATPAEHARQLGKPDYHFTICQLLVLNWLNKSGPLTAEAVCKMAGCSFPTVARTLKALGPIVKRQPDRSFELDRFPRDEWFKMVANAPQARGTINFTDRSGQPRTPDNLARRLQKLKLPNVAIGGVMGAKRLRPSLDLVGNPRLDLTIHCPGSSVDLDFVAELDPALKETDDSSQYPNLVLHVIRRRDSLFKSTAAQNWADPLECLLDLNEARLDQQALEFLDHLIARRKDIAP